MESILNRIARSNQVTQQFLEYIGIQDKRHTVGKTIYLFNIMGPAHRRYKPTVTYVETTTIARNIP